MQRMNNPKSFQTPRLVTSADELRRLIDPARAAGTAIGLVPTMGALHAGHVSLVDASRGQCGLTIATVFVNPTQFGPGEDFAHYPRALEADLALLGQHGAEVVFAPPTEAIYPPGYATFVEVGGPAAPWEGQFRPGHFRGVATVVLKLFNLVRPDRAYFGHKDYQQTLVVRRMVEDLHLPIRVEICPTVREADGLAMSSRNVYLSPDERRRALSIFESLQLTKQLVAQGTRDATALVARMHELLYRADLRIDYVAIADPRSLELVNLVDRPTIALIAARAGTTRLIDNLMIA
jgi:pantoate--beta-alanine ligase